MAESYEGLQSYAQAIKGDEAFAQRTMREAGRSKCRVRVLTEAQVVSGVAGGLGMKPRELMRAGRQRAESRARLIAAYLGRAIGGIPVSRTAKYFGREESTFVRGVLRLEEKLRTDANLRRQVAPGQRSPSKPNNTGSTRLTPLNS
jgi:chromosomal replication initiation ATPase DnaA